MKKLHTLYTLLNRRMTWAVFSFLLPVGVFACIIWTYRDYSLIWDSRLYFSNCIFPATHQAFSLAAYNCFNHGSLAFGLLYGIPYFLSSEDIFFIHLTSFILMIVAFGFLYATLKYLFNNYFWISVGMALICWNPAIIANTLNPTPDLLVLAFSMMCLWAALTQRVAYLMLFGMGLFFSKESGFIYYTFCCFFYLMNNWADYKKKIFFRNAFILFIPFIFYACFMWYKTQIKNENFLYQERSVYGLFQLGSPFHAQNLNFYTALSSMFVLNFQWVVSSVILLSVLYLLCNSLLYKRHQYTTILQIKQIGLIALLSLSMGYTLSRFPSFSNTRYYLLIFPLTTILFLYALKNFQKKIAYALSSVLAFILLISCFKMIDPLSRVIYGTFYFGDYPLLKMTSITHECCGYGRDQLVYNLEHIQFQILLNKFSQTVQLAEHDAIITNPLADYNIYGNITNDTYQFTLKNTNVHSFIHIYDLKEIKQLVNIGKISRVFYLEAPNVENDAFKATVFTYFEPLTHITVENHGYRLQFFALRSK